MTTPAAPAKTPKPTRGIRNNNPGNVIRSSTSWQGEVPDHLKTDDDYEQMISPEYGLRMICVILLNYRANSGLKTIAGIISRWCPPKGKYKDGTAYTNHTEAYIAGVAKALGVGRDTPIDVRRPDVMRKMLRAITWQENSQDPYTDAQLTAAMRLAGMQVD